MKSLPKRFVGEFAGTFLMVIFGCGSVSAAVLRGAQVGFFQVAIVLGLVVCIGDLSDASTTHQCVTHPPM